MSSDWTDRSLGDVAKIVGGGTPSTKRVELWDGGIPWLTPKDLRSHDGLYVDGGERTISAEGLSASSAQLLPEGSVLVSSRAPIGYVAVARRPMATNQGFRNLVLRDGHVPEFFAYLLKTSTQRLQGQVSQQAEQAVKQFVSERLAASDVIDVFELGGDERPELSILSDEFLDKITKGLAQPELGVAILKKILSDEIRVRSRTNRMQAKLFGDRLRAVLDRYEARQITSGEVIERLVELARNVREARRRHEALGLSIEEVAFYDALAGGSEEWKADERIAEIARALVRGVKEDLSLDWADHEATEAAIKVKIKRLLRRYKFEAPKGGGGRNVDRVVGVLLDQARELYRFWPDVPLRELPL
jgi:type I restriction enzyme R subunit